MIRFTRTNADNTDFIELVRQLDADLAQRDGSDHSFYAQFNKRAMLRFVIVGFENEQAVACGAMKELATDIMEIKRMFVLPPYRGQGLATGVLEELEKWAAETGIATCRLETGKRQPEAIALYLKNGYRVIPNYGQYAGIDNSVCFEKKLGERLHQL